METIGWWLLIFAAFIPIICAAGKISNKRLCADPKCKTVISQGRAIVRHVSSDPQFLSFQPGEMVEITSKSAGSRNDLWGGRVRGKDGYFPYKYVKEYKLFNPNPAHVVDTTPQTGKDEEGSVPFSADSIAKLEAEHLARQKQEEQRQKHKEEQREQLVKAATPEVAKAKPKVAKAEPEETKTEPEVAKGEPEVAKPEPKVDKTEETEIDETEVDETEAADESPSSESEKQDLPQTKDSGADGSADKKGSMLGLGSGSGAEQPQEGKTPEVDETEVDETEIQDDAEAAEHKPDSEGKKEEQASEVDETEVDETETVEGESSKDAEVKDEAAATEADAKEPEAVDEMQMDQSDISNEDIEHVGKDAETAKKKKVPTATLR